MTRGAQSAMREAVEGTMVSCSLREAVPSASHQRLRPRTRAHGRRLEVPVGGRRFDGYLCYAEHTAACWDS